MLDCVEAVHKINCLEDYLLVFDFDLSAYFKKPVDHSSPKLAGDLYLIS